VTARKTLQIHVSSRPHDPERARDMLERAADAYRALAAFTGIGPGGGGVFAVCVA